MKVYPTKKKNKKWADENLTTAEHVTKTIALLVAFVTVFFFFFKILFF